MIVDPRRDHSFPIPRPLLSDAVGSPDPCLGCHVDEDADWAAAAMAGWHGDPAPHPFADVIAAGRRGDLGAWDALADLAGDPDHPPIVRATALSLIPRFADWAPDPAAIEAGLVDASPLVRAAAAEALSTMPLFDRLDRAEHLLSDPVRTVRIAVGRQLAPLAASGLQSDLVDRLRAVVAEVIASDLASAERPEAMTRLGNLYGSMGDLEAAEAAYLEALTLDPDWLPALINLSELRRGRGDADGAYEMLEAAVADNPASGGLQHALGLALVRQRRYEVAVAALQAAWELEPANPRFGYVLGVALNSTGDAGAAIAVLSDVVTAHPAHRPALIALFQMLLAADRPTEARAVAARVLESVPGDLDFLRLSRLLNR